MFFIPIHSDIAVLQISQNSSQSEGQLFSSLKDPISVGGFSIPNAIRTGTQIDRGDSGRSLLDTRGEMIEMNTAILSGIHAFSGIGFTIPS